MLGLGLNIKPFVSSAPYLEAANKFILAAGYTNTGVKEAIIKLFNTIYSNGLDNKLAALYLDTTDLLAGSQSEMIAQMKYNALNPLDTDAAYRQTYVNSPTLSLYGVVGNGTTQYINTHINPSLESKIILNNTALGVYCNTNTNNSNCIECGVAQGSPINSLYLAARFTTAANYGAINDTSFTISAVSGQNTDAIISGNRINSTTVVHKRNNTTFSTFTKASSGIPNAKIYRLAYQGSAGSPLYFSNRRQQAFYIGNLTEAEEIILNTAINVYNGDIETPLGLASGSRKRF